MTPLDQIADGLYHFEDEAAFCIGDKYYSYGDLRNIISGIQHQIIETGISGHCNIGILAYDDIETYASVLAVLFLGHAFVPVNPMHPPDRNRDIIHQADVRLLLSGKDDTSAGNFINEKTKLIITGSQPAARHLIRVPLSPYQHAYILFTSGSTGVPKGVPVTINNLNAFLEAFFSNGYNVGHEDRFIQMFDLTFDLSIMGYLAPLCIGACVYTVPPDAIKYVQVYKLLEKYEITFALLAPSILTGLRQFFPEISLPKMEYSLFCGESLFEDIAMEWSECIPNATIQNVYGPTEATIFCMAYTMSRTGGNKSYNGILSIGKPMKNTCVLTAGADLKPIAPGEKGELCLTGDQVTPGYLKNESLNQDAFFNFDGSRYYRSGDLCYCDDAGDYFYCGRMDFQVKVNGFRVELGEIEHHAREFFKSHHVAVIATESADKAVLISLFAEGYHSDFDSLSKYLKTKMPSYMIPSKYFSVEKFPLNSNGKIDRKMLVKMFS